MGEVSGSLPRACSVKREAPGSRPVRRDWREPHPVRPARRRQGKSGAAPRVAPPPCWLGQAWFQFPEPAPSLPAVPRSRATLSRRRPDRTGRQSCSQAAEFAATNVSTPRIRSLKKRGWSRFQQCREAARGVLLAASRPTRFATLVARRGPGAGARSPSISALRAGTAGAAGFARAATGLAHAQARQRRIGARRIAMLTRWLISNMRRSTSFDSPGGFGRLSASLRLGLVRGRSRRGDALRLLDRRLRALGSCSARCRP